MGNNHALTSLIVTVLAAVGGVVNLLLTLLVRGINRRLDDLERARFSNGERLARVEERLQIRRETREAWQNLESSDTDGG
jgi:hypothetical protein